MRTSHWLVSGLALAICTSCTPVRRVLARPEPVRQASNSELRVPYVSQSELLCGGAAIAMIERWWGRRGVYAEEFASLVRRTDGGILTSDMAKVMRSRGWVTDALSTTAVVVRQSVKDGVPVIAMIQVGRKRYHYVVIVGWADDQVTYHDPAVSPSITIPATEFLRRWDGARRWAMFVRPAPAGARVAPKDSASRPAAPLTSTADSLPCRPALDDAADAASKNQLDDALRILTEARGSCPAEPLVVRELAGVKFRQGAHVEAARLAEEYTRLAPTDSLGWLLLASARYLADDRINALEAWNRVGRPQVDLLRIDGSRRVRFRAIADGTGIESGSILTPSRLRMAQRRIADIPALATSRITYDAVAGGVVEVNAAVVEKPLIDPLRQLLIVESSRALVARQIMLHASTPFGAGELWAVHWRWRSADPLLALQLDIPAHIIVPTIVRIERRWETFRFSDEVAEQRRSASTLSVGGWARPDLELRSGARAERWSEDGDYAALFAGGALHRDNDRLSLAAEAEHAIAVSGNDAYQRLSSRLAWVLPVDRHSNTWSMRVGGDWNSSTTPRGLWPLVGGGLMRAIPLRAHPAIIDNRLPSTRIGRLVVHGGIGADRPVTTIGRVALGAGIFMDGAHISSPVDGSQTSRLYLDAGSGLRASVVGLPWAAVRIDVARGLATDRRWGVSAAVSQSLPVRLGRPR